MSKVTSNPQTLVKARKASRVIGCLLIFGGAVLLLVGFIQQSLPGVLNGITMMVSSTLMFAVSKIIEKKLNKLGV